MKTIQFTIASFRVVVLLLLTTILVGWSHADTSPNIETPTDDHLITAVVEVGPFFINTRYRSGEGPGRKREISIGKLITNRETV